jgi:hypothetical protein
VHGEEARIDYSYVPPKSICRPIEYS